MGGTCSMYSSDEIHKRFSWGRLKEGIALKVKLK